MEKLEFYDWQYTVRHSINDFKIGDEVFLRSNPEIKMRVHWFNKDTITTSYAKYGYGGFGDFVPETLLKFKYACLVTHAKSNYKFCLN